MKSEDVVTVDVVTNPVEAQVIANVLHAEGVACTIEGNGQAGVTGNVEIRILVKAWDADRARKALKRIAAVPSSNRKRLVRSPRVRMTRAANGIRRQRVAAKARRGVSPT